MPSIPANAATAALKIYRDEQFHILLTIEHDDFGVRRYTNNDSDIVSNGNTFTAFPFFLELPTGSDGVPTGSLRIGNVGRILWPILERLNESPVITIELVLASDLDTVIDSYDMIELARVTAGETAVEGSLTQEVYIDEPWPSIRLTPEFAPWLSR